MSRSSFEDNNQLEIADGSNQPFVDFDILESDNFRFSQQYIEKRPEIRSLIKDGYNIYEIGEQINISFWELIQCCDNDPSILNLYQDKLESKYEQNRPQIAEMINEENKNLYEISSMVGIPYLNLVEFYQRDTQMQSLYLMVIRKRYNVPASSPLTFQTNQR